MKRSFIVILIFALLMPSSIVFANNDNIDIFINDKLLNAKGTIINGSTLVPLRSIFEALGATVEWDGTTKTVTSKKDGISLELVIGEAVAKRNGENVKLTTSARIINNSTYVPVRFIGEAFGSQVDWDGTTKTVYVVDKDDPLTDDLFEAFYDNNYELAKELIENSNINVNAKDKLNKRTPLMYAIMYDYNDLSETLINKGTDINIVDNTYNTALSLAVWNKNYDIVKLLLEKGADPNFKNNYNKSILETAVTIKRDYDIAKLLLEHDADQTINDPYNIYHGSLLLQIFSTLIYKPGTDSSYAGYTTENKITETASIEPNEEILVLLLEYGAELDVNTKYENTMPLHFALYYNFDVLAKEFIINGADVNYSDYLSNTPLFIATRNDSVEIVKLLLEVGADPNYVNKYNTPILSIAIFNRSYEIVELLLENGANPNATDHLGNSMLLGASDWISSYNHDTGESTDIPPSIDIVKILIEYGADVNTVFPNLFERHTIDLDIVELLLQSGADPNGTTATLGEDYLDRAIIFRNYELANLLRSYGAK